MSNAKVRSRRRRRARKATPPPPPRAPQITSAELRAEIDDLLHVADISGFGGRHAAKIHNFGVNPVRTQLQSLMAFVAVASMGVSW